MIEPKTVIAIRKLIQETYLDDRLREYIVRLGRATRDPAQFGITEIADAISVGISPRAYHHILALSKTVAFFDGRSYVLPEDVKSIGLPALRHRIIRSVQAEAAGLDADEILSEILRKVPIP